MSDTVAAADLIDPTPTDWAGAAMRARMRKRYAADRLS